MRVTPGLLVTALLVFPTADVAAAGTQAAQAAQAKTIASFDGLPVAAFPSGWKARDQVGAARVYRVHRENGEQFLHAEAEGESVQIGMPVDLTLTDYPMLSWRWRVVELPAGADEMDAATNDSAAGVYVVFKGGLGGLLPRAIKYVWSAREPRGTTIPSPRYPNARIVVLESGTEHLGRWRTETVNVLEDYRRLFGSEPPLLQGVALLTDADDTGSRAVADYGELRMLPISDSDTPAARLAQPAL